MKSFFFSAWQEILFHRSGVIRHEFKVFNPQTFLCKSDTIMNRRLFIWLTRFGLFPFSFSFALCAVSWNIRKQRSVTFNASQFCHGIWDAMCYNHRKYSCPSPGFFGGVVTPPPPQSLWKVWFWFILKLTFKNLGFWNPLPLEFPTTLAS